jgi:hypothetical protein
MATPTATMLPPPPIETPVPEVTIGDPEKGRQYFGNVGANEATAGYEMLCVNCHTIDGKEEKIHRSPDLQGIFVRAGETVPGLTAAQYIYKSIMDPRA